MDNIDTIEKESENFYFKNLKRFLTEWHVKFKEDINIDEVIIVFENMQKNLEWYNNAPNVYMQFENQLEINEKLGECEEVYRDFAVNLAEEKFNRIRVKKFNRIRGYDNK